MIVIIDYKMGNIGSILNMFKKLNVKAIASSNHTDIENADKLILPGVGAFDTGMKNLKELNLINLLNHKVLEQKTPILGICIGMHLMAKKSEEGSEEGLGWFDAEVKKFNFDNLDKKYCIPCMGWNIIKPNQYGKLFPNQREERFYFVHSYHMVCQEPDSILATATYGYDYTAAISRDNIYGVQFHPEKSHRFGLEMFQNFIEHC